MEELLRVKDLTTKLMVRGKPVTVVDNISFSLKRGKTLAVVGESGCGKSMTALSILRLIPQELLASTTGVVEYEGKNLLTMPHKELRALRGSHLAMIFQNPSSSLNPVYTVGEQMRELLWYHSRIEGDEADALIIQALRDVGISSPEERIGSYPHQLSGGMLQRVMIAMALLLKPKILIADEPTTALDVTVQAQVLELMKSLQERFHMAILLITHDMGVVAERADDVMVMYATENIERATALDLFKKPLHPYTKGLFAARPRLGGIKNRFEAIKGSVPEIHRLPTGCHFHPRCPFRMEKCLQGEVEEFTVEKHEVKCWLYEEGKEGHEPAP